MAKFKNNVQGQRMAPAQQGYALMMSVLILLLITAVGMYMMKQVNVSIEKSGHDRNRTRTTFAAQGLISLVSQEFTDDPSLAKGRYCPDSGITIMGVTPSMPVKAKLAGGSQLYTGHSASYVSPPIEVDGAHYLQMPYDGRYNSSSDYLKFQVDQSAIVYVAYDNSADTPPTWLQDWEQTTKTVGSTVATFRLYKKHVLAGSIVSTGGNLQGQSSDDFEMYTVIVDGRGGDRSASVGADTVLYNIGGCNTESGPFYIDVVAFTGTQASKKHITKLRRGIGGQVTVGTVGDTLFPWTVGISTDLYLGRFNDNWTGMPPIFIGDIVSSKTITLGPPGLDNVGTPLNIAHFGYDWNNSDGDGDSLTGIRDDAGQPREVARLFSSDGLLWPDPQVTSADEIWVNWKPSTSDGYNSKRWSNDCGNLSKMLEEKCKLGTSNGIPGGKSVEHESHGKVPAMSSVNDFIDHYELKTLAQDGGIVITSTGTAVSSDVLWDWNIRKKALLWVIDMASLPIPSGFNGFIYIEKNSGAYGGEFDAIQLKNLESLSHFVEWDADGTAKKGLTIATPNSMYTVGSINEDGALDLALVSDYYTLLSKSWVNSLSVFSNNADRERSLTLHNQHWEAMNESWCDNTSDPCLWKGFCEDEWAGVVSEVNDIVTNWYFRDAYGRELRREPRNNPNGYCGSSDPYCHYDSTTVQAVIVAGYSYPDADNPPRTFACSHTTAAPSMGVTVANNTSTTGASRRYDQDKVRLNDAFHFLEAWVGRFSGERWSHEVILHGGFSALWQSVEQGRSWASSYEANAGHNITWRTPLHTHEGWYEETDALNKCAGGYTTRKQSKMGTSTVPTIQFNYKLHQAPGLGGYNPKSSNADVTFGTWKRDYGELD